MSVTADDILNYNRVGDRQLFIIGTRDTRITIYSQQLRALNTVWALFETEQLKDGSKVCIIGGGVAGVTAAAALISRGIKPKLFEKTGRLLGVQAGNHTRFVHPNIYDWPSPMAAVPTTSLPFLNWKRNTAGEVNLILMNEWREFSGNCDVILHAEAKSVVPGSGAMIEVQWVDHGTGLTDIDAFDLVLVAAGFGPERTLHGVPTTSYWRDDPLHQVDAHGKHSTKIAIIGAGDGGLTDAVRLCINDFDHGDFLAKFGERSDSIEIGKKLLRIDKAAAFKSGTDAVSYVKREFDECDVTAGMTNLVLSSRRGDTIVTLYEAAGSPYLPTASMLNRLILKVLIDTNSIEFVPKEFLAEDIANYDRVIPRLGPSSNLRPLLDAWNIEPIVDIDTKLEIATKRFWSPTFFLNMGHRRKAFNVLVLLHQRYAHNALVLEAIHAGINKNNAKIDGKYVSCSEYQMDISSAAAIEKCISDYSVKKYDSIIILDSDIALLSDKIINLTDTLIISCEAQVCRNVVQSLRKNFPSKNVFSVIQELDLNELVDMIETAFEGLSICYIRDKHNVSDEIYFNILFNGLKSRIMSSREGIHIFDFIVDGELKNEEIPKADIYTGRWFIHQYISPQFFSTFPFVSGYRSDLELGALAVYDVNGAECGNYIVEHILLKLANLESPSAADWFIRDCFLGINLGQSERYNISLPIQFIRKANLIIG